MMKNIHTHTRTHTHSYMHIDTHSTVLKCFPKEIVPLCLREYWTTLKWSFLKFRRQCLLHHFSSSLGLLLMGRNWNLTVCHIIGSVLDLLTSTYSRARSTIPLCLKIFKNYWNLSSLASFIHVLRSQRLGTSTLGLQSGLLGFVVLGESGCLYGIKLLFFQSWEQEG